MANPGQSNRERWIMNIIESILNDVMRKMKYCYDIAYLRNLFLYNKPNTTDGTGLPSVLGFLQFGTECEKKEILAYHHGKF